MRRFLMGFVHAGRGLAAGLQGETNLKVMLAGAAVAVGLGLYRQLDRLEWVAIILCIGLVISLELANTAVERLLDVIHPEHDPRVGRVKDILAAAVLVAAVAAAVVGALIFLT